MEGKKKGELREGEKKWKEKKKPERRGSLGGADGFGALARGSSLLNEKKKPTKNKERETDRDDELKRELRSGASSPPLG